MKLINSTSILINTARNELAYESMSKKNAQK